MTEAAPIVQMVPTDQINILNPRSRNRIVFQGMVANISNLGLKRPITVARRLEPTSDGKAYDLVCGQGRLEAFVALGQTEIPAIVREASREECYLMSLVENIARRQIRPLELLREIESLKSRGYTTAEIAKKLMSRRATLPASRIYLRTARSACCTPLTRAVSLCRLPCR